MIVNRFPGNGLGEMVYGKIKIGNQGSMLGEGSLGPRDRPGESNFCRLISTLIFEGMEPGIKLGAFTWSRHSRKAWQGFGYFRRE